MIGLKLARFYCRSFPSIRQRTGEPQRVRGLWPHLQTPAKTGLSLCSRAPGYTSFVINTIIPIWLSQMDMLSLSLSSKVIKNKDSVSLGFLIPAPNTAWYLVQPQPMTWGWAELPVSKDTWHLETNTETVFQIYNTTDRSSILRRLEHATLWRETNRKMVWAGYSFLFSTKKHCSLFSATSNVRIRTVLQGSLDGNSVISCMPASSQTAVGQSKIIHPGFFHFM